ncbi:polyprenyl synthetase [Streptomyces sp. NPDC050428]|uniref:polyprenyl synthetase n=1 Tax=Streptomyces sp. NPDC050428 TaxID=3155757 RepID=UPI00341E7218
MPQDVERDGNSGGRPVLLLAGLADLALSTCGSAVRAACGLLGRSDIGALAAQGRQDLQARGRLALDRLGTDPPGAGLLGTGDVAHMEVLARHARLRLDTADGTVGGTGA